MGLSGLAHRPTRKDEPAPAVAGSDEAIAPAKSPGTGCDAPQSLSRERFNRLVLPHIDSAYNLARWLCGHDDRAADVAQEALLRAFQYRDGIRGDDARAWLLTIVRNTFFTTLAERKRRTAGYEEYVEEAHGAWTESASVLYQKPQTPEEALVLKSERLSINACLEALPISYREAIVLRDLEDLPYKDIARVLGVPIGTVMSRLARGRKMLAARFRPDGDDR